MNRARLTTSDQVRSESQACIEARRSQFAFSPVAARTLQIQCMWTALAKKGKRGNEGKGDGKNGKKGGEGQNQSQNPNPSKDVVCWHCRTKGHSSTERWSNPKNQCGSGGIQNKGGKGKQKNGTGKGAGSLEQGEQAAVVEPQLQPALASSLDMASFETPVPKVS